MNFITFSSATTNIFPAANSTTGSQLVTEYNIRSRETVATNSEVTYTIGPSYVHGEPDFEVNILMDAGGAYINGYTLQIAEGRGVINGHYVETLAPMTIDLVEANAKLQSEARPVLKGDLAIGIRTFYSTDQTVAGSILVEDEDEMFLGIQLVILPQEEFITPAQSPLDKTKVTADLLLATFTFINNNISNLKNSTKKLEYLNSDRIANLDNWISDRYVTKYGLNSKKIYAFAGKGANPATGYDTWEDATDSLMVWDADPVRTLEKPSLKQAEFTVSNDRNYLVLPHKQITGMTDEDGNDEYYAPRILAMPMADYGDNTPGMVNKAYTQQIKSLASKVNDFRTDLTGKQIYFMDTRTSTDELPEINDAWDTGDYILVKYDEHFNGDSSDTASPPATKYVVLPGQVDQIKFVAQVDGDAGHPAPIPSDIVGYPLVVLEWMEEAGQERPDTEYPEYYPIFFGSGDTMRGTPYDAGTSTWYDYFKVRYYPEYTGSGTDPHAYTDYYYGVLTAGPRQWSDAVMVTGQVAFATEDEIGGFLNASEDAVDYGYVRLDDTGHLVLTDYEILRSGTLAYQIAADATIPDASDYDTLQGYFDDYINERVAFPKVPNTAATPSILNIYVNLPEVDEGGTLNIHGIDSRFNTAVCFHFMGAEVTNNVTINISDCEKIIIDSHIEGTPVINVVRTCLYYDPVIFNYIRTCARDASVYGDFTGFQDLSIWHVRRTTEDPALVVDGMTVSELQAQVISTEIDYWKELGTAANDNNYLVALKSITFAGNGDIVGCEVLAANNSTDNVEPGEKMVVGDFVLPQGATLTYPLACLVRKLKITGTFTSAYCSDATWYVSNNSFTLLTGTYDPYSLAESMTGTIAFHSSTVLIPSTISQTSIEPWEPDTYNIFRGGAIS